MAHTSLVLVAFLESELGACARELLDGLVVARAIESKWLVRLLSVWSNTGQLHIAQFPLPDGVRFALSFLTSLRLSLALVLLLVELLLTTLGQAELPQVHGGVPTRRDKATVVVEPGNRAHNTLMRLENIVRRVLSRVEFEHVNVLAVHAGKQVTTVGEGDLTARLDGQ